MVLIMHECCAQLKGLVTSYTASHANVDSC